MDLNYHHIFYFNRLTELPQSFHDDSFIRHFNKHTIYANCYIHRASFFFFFFQSIIFDLACLLRLYVCCEYIQWKRFQNLGLVYSWNVETLNMNNWHLSLFSFFLTCTEYIPLPVNSTRHRKYNGEENKHIIFSQGSYTLLWKMGQKMQQNKENCQKY